MDETHHDAEHPLSIGELSERADVSRRTIRFYIQRGLLAPPLGGGRGSHYSAAHLERLLAVKRLQEVGIPLEVISARLGPPSFASTSPISPPPTARPLSAPPSSPAQAPSVPPSGPSRPSPPSIETWLRLAVAPGVDLLVREGALTPSAIDDLVDTARLIARRNQLELDTPPASND